MKKIYSGYLSSSDYGDNYDNLMLCEDFGSGLIDDIQNDCSKYGNFVNFRYYISEKEFDLKDLEEYIVGNYFGLSDIALISCGCPTCGTMCVGSANIGGHNIYHELLSHEGEYCIVEIDFYKDSGDRIINSTK